jgi:hypothetical protein
MTSEGASTMKTTSMTTLEVLRDARDRLADPDAPYEHERWSSCTCGHIYRAHQGVYGNPVQGPGRLDAAYARVILDAAAALGWDGSRLPGSRYMGDCARVASVYVSDYTVRRAQERTLPGILTAFREDAAILTASREDAIAVLDDAISAIEATDRAAMQVVAGLDGPSRTVIVEPAEIPDPTRTPDPDPDRVDPVPVAPEPVRHGEPVPA